MAKKTSSLVDPITKRPIEYEVLDKEVSAPTLGGVRSIMSTSPSGNLDPYRLAGIMRRAAEGEADAFFELAEEMEEKYLHYLGVIGTRKRAVSQLEITVNAALDTPEQQKHADLIRQFLKRDTLEAELFSIMDAVGKGISFTEIVWDTSKTPWLPSQLKRRDPRWFEFDKVDGETPLLKNDGGMPTPLDPYKYIIHTHEAKSGLPIKGGLARGIGWAYLFQNMALKDWVIFAEVFGMPIRVGKYDSNASEQDRRKLLQAVMGIATDAAAIIPQSMQIEFVNAAASGNADVFQNLCTYIDQQVSKAVLGQTATTDAVAGGLGGSQGTVHNDVRSDIQRADAKLLAATLNRDLVRPIIDFNFGPPKDGQYPTIEIGQSETLSAERFQMISDFVEMGGNIGKSVVRDLLGFEDPGEDEELLQPKRTNAPQGAITPEGGQGQPLAASTPVFGLLNPSYFHSKPTTQVAASAAAPEPADKDEIDDLVDGFSDGEWEVVFDPILAPIEEALAASANFDEFKNNLIASIGKMDSSKMTELLARSGFAARLLGETQDGQ